MNRKPAITAKATLGKTTKIAKTTACILLALYQFCGPQALVASGQGSRPAIPISIRSKFSAYTPGAYYLPSLPSPKFINGEQEQIYDSIKPNVVDFVRFDDGSPARPDTQATGYHLKAWTNEERADVERLLDCILHIAPGLLIKAASGDKVALCRTSSLPVHSSQDGPNEGGPSAVTCPGVIVLADSFFLTYKQFHGLAHEFVHECDLTGRVCYSKEWVDFINPTITKLRLTKALSPTWKADEQFNQARRSNTCPTAYSCTNLPESLAEFTAAYLDDSGYESDPAFIKGFANKMLLPSVKDLQSDASYKMGLIKYKNQELEPARSLLLATCIEEPTLAYPRAYLANTCLKLKDYNEALKFSSESVEKFKNAGVPYTSAEMRFAIRCQSAAQWQTKQSDQIAASDTQILNKIPFASSELMQRSSLEANHGSYSEAGRDLYLSYFGKQYATLFEDADADVDLTLKMLDDEVARFPKWAMVLLRRAHFHEWLGDRELIESNKVNHYKLAQSDYKTAEQLDCTFAPEILFDCFNISLKLGDKSAAERYQAMSVERSPLRIETKVMQVQMLDLRGQSKEAAKEYSALRGQFLQGRF